MVGAICVLALILTIIYFYCRLDYSSRLIAWLVFLFFLMMPAIDLCIYVYTEANESTSWLSNDYARITDVDFKAVVHDENGENYINVKEKLTFDIHAAFKNNLYWEFTCGQILYFVS